MTDPRLKHEEKNRDDRHRLAVVSRHARENARDRLAQRGQDKRENFRRDETARALARVAMMER